MFKFVFVFAFLFLSFQSCPAKPADLRFKIILDKTEYKEQEPINATFELENQGQDPVLVNKRFYIGSKQYQGEVILKVTSLSGDEIPNKASYETGLPKTDYFEAVEPNKKITSEYPRNLRGYFVFPEPGVYKVEAVYKNVFGKEIGLDVFNGQLSSEPVTFKIIKE